MKQLSFLKYLPIVCIVALVAAWYVQPYEHALDNIFLSMAIFLFATLSGFFISSQYKRYARIVSYVSDFDGTMSYLYRSSSVFGSDAQSRIAEILRTHYQSIIECQDWDHYFNHKSSTLTDINALVDSVTTNPDGINAGQSAFASRAYFGLADMQKIRKNLITLYRARIPRLQWWLIDMLALMLVVSVMVIPSEGYWLAFVIKASFATVIVAVLVLIRKVNDLTLFETMAGRASAQDVLDIIEGTR